MPSSDPRPQDAGSSAPPAPARSRTALPARRRNLLPFLITGTLAWAVAAIVVLTRGTMSGDSFLSCLTTAVSGVVVGLCSIGWVLAGRRK
ncbi:DUF2530 domain-containing protein [Rarobacter incanus]|uniref:Uncharacterized protein DUF2530 n=1 Tax=Rarobacter incanus TaxID=153494 RepID=A0A542SNX7_9MICO|nr:DUF2530 domain-containing protein [Rarobacter incanus]TQK76320.1 uncharacterized protein DUF2530 [Rarobacter incanus]